MIANVQLRCHCDEKQGVLEIFSCRLQTEIALLGTNVTHYSINKRGGDMAALFLHCTHLAHPQLSLSQERSHETGCSCPHFIDDN